MIASTSLAIFRTSEILRGHVNPSLVEDLQEGICYLKHGYHKQRKVKTKSKQNEREFLRIKSITRSLALTSTFASLTKNSAISCCLSEIAK